MTDRGQDQQRRPADYYHVKPLPDPVREPDMQQSEQTFQVSCAAQAPPRQP